MNFLEKISKPTCFLLLKRFSEKFKLFFEKTSKNDILGRAEIWNENACILGWSEIEICKNQKEL
jgi:hypothetical protein